MPICKSLFCDILLLNFHISRYCHIHYPDLLFVSMWKSHNMFTHSFWIAFSVLWSHQFLDAGHWNIILFVEVPMHHCCKCIMSFQIQVPCLQGLLIAVYQVLYCFFCFFAQSALAAIIWFLNLGLDCIFVVAIVDGVVDGGNIYIPLFTFHLFIYHFSEKHNSQSGWFTLPNKWSASMSRRTAQFLILCHYLSIKGLYFLCLHGFLMKNSVLQNTNNSTIVSNSNPCPNHGGGRGSCIRILSQN